MGYFQAKLQMQRLTFESAIKDIISNDEYQKLKGFSHHGGSSRFDHCIKVAKASFYIASFFRLNSREAARGAMLHDFYLYCNGHGKIIEHLKVHPGNALAHARKSFELTAREEEIILCHMWPLAGKLPKYPESYIVNITDTICAFKEYYVNSKAQRSRNGEQKRSFPLQPQIPYEQGQ